MTVQAALIAELERRRTRNPKSSLRGLARTLGVSHSALSRLCQGRSLPSMATARRIADRLRLPATAPESSARETTERRLIAAASHPAFKADARWLAVRLGASVDDVQIALHEAIRCGRLVMTNPHSWRAIEGP